MKGRAVARILAIVEACYAGWWLVLVGSAGHIKPETDSGRVWIGALIILLSGQLPFLGAAVLLASRAPTFKTRRLMKVVGWQWLIVFPATCLVIVVGMLIERPTGDVGLDVVMVLLELAFGIPLGTAAFLPALLVSSVLIERATRAAPPAANTAPP